MTGQTVYGTAGGFEQMLDVNLAEDGTCEVVPLEAPRRPAERQGHLGGHR